MAITITPEITGQTADFTYSYAYLYDVLPIRVQTDVFPLERLNISVSVIDASEDSEIILSTSVDYVSMDFNASGVCYIDVMEIIQQHIQDNWYKIGVESDIDWKTVITKYVYKLTLNVGAASAIIRKIPIIGGRSYDEFTPVVNYQNITDDFAGNNPSFIGYPKFEVALSNETNGFPFEPTITMTIPTTGCKANGGMLIWKSHLGGWNSYGFNIFTEVKQNSYLNELGLETFKSINGHSYIATNYTGLQSSSSISMKAVSISREHGEALKGLQLSPAVYLKRTPISKLELVRITSVSGFGNNLANGYSVEVGLQTINFTKQLVR